MIRCYLLRGVLAKLLCEMNKVALLVIMNQIWFCVKGANKECNMSTHKCGAF